MLSSSGEHINPEISKSAGVLIFTMQCCIIHKNSVAELDFQVPVIQESGNLRDISFDNYPERYFLHLSYTQGIIRTHAVVYSIYG